MKRQQRYASSYTDKSTGLRCICISNFDETPIKRHIDAGLTIEKDVAMKAEVDDTEELVSMMPKTQEFPMIVLPCGQSALGKGVESISEITAWKNESVSSLPSLANIGDCTHNHTAATASTTIIGPTSTPIHDRIEDLKKLH